MRDSQVIAYVSSQPIGKYRSIMGAIRRAWKSRQTGKPVKRLRRTIRQDARDVRWAADVRDRDFWKCRLCSASKAYSGARIEAAHIVPRRYKAARHELINGLALCHQCHQWAHTHQTEFMEAVDREVLPELVDRLYNLVPSWKGWRSLSTQKASG